MVQPSMFKTAHRPLRACHERQTYVGSTLRFALSPRFRVSWSDVTRHSLFAPLAARYRVIALDPPGLGDSAKPAPCYDIEGVARIVWSAVDALAIDRLDIVGFDIGMWLGYPMALQQAARVRSLTLIDAVIPGLVPWHHSTRRPPTAPGTSPSTCCRAWPRP